MPYIRADGTVAEGTRRPNQNVFLKMWNWIWGLEVWERWVLVAIVGVLLKTWPSSNPLANGSIPAVQRMPQEHWEHIANDEWFVRDMTEHLGTQEKDKTAEGIAMEEDLAFFFELEHMDFGGSDGHVAERLDVEDAESSRTTRCSTSRSALTAYFCGAKVANNHNVALGMKRKFQNFGVESFSQFLTCRYKQGERNGGEHRRSVYRLGIGCKDKLAGYSHAWNIIAQPNGTFYWLQSYIQHYSLATWMQKTTPLGKLRARMTLEELLGKLSRMDQLMKIDAWTQQANEDYLDLFNVDKNLVRLTGRTSRRQKLWNPDHRLTMFVWDEACEYPIPSDGQSDQRNKESEPDPSLDTFKDECVAATTIGLLDELKSVLGEMGNFTSEEEDLIAKFLDNHDAPQEQDVETMTTTEQGGEQDVKQIVRADPERGAQTDGLSNDTSST